MAKVHELRDRREAERWLAAGVCLARLDRPAPARVTEAAPWLVLAQAEAAAMPPPGVVADLGRLLHHGPGTFHPAPPSTPRLAEALRRYEHQLLGRLAGDRRLEAAADAVARLAPALREEAVAVTVDALCHRLGFDAGLFIEPAAARNLARRDPAEVLRDGLGCLAGPGPLPDLLALGYERLAHAAGREHVLLSDADVFTLENLGTLRTLGLRVAARQVAEAADAFDEVLPRHVKGRRAAGRHAPTHEEDEDPYPTGGFSALSTSGSMENLVTSELVYMEDDKDPTAIDLFDLRYVEGELLYYTRDESVFVRRRREVVFALEPSLVCARFKDPELRFQRLVVALGLVLCLVRRLSQWLAVEEALSFEVAFVADAVGLQPLGPERDLCRLLLKEWTDKGVLTVSEHRSRAALEEELARRARRSVCDLLAFSAGGATAQGPGLERSVQVLPIDLATAAPVLSDLEPPGASASAWEAWVGLARELVARMV